MYRAIILTAALLAIASSEAGSQQVQDPLPFRDRLMLEQPHVIPGPDVGFRITGWDGEIPIGQLVVKVKGAWVAAEISN